MPQQLVELAHIILGWARSAWDRGHFLPYIGPDRFRFDCVEDTSAAADVAYLAGSGEATAVVAVAVDAAAADVVNLS